MASLRKQFAARASIDFVVVFVGIWAALLADSWREGRDARAREVSYHASLLEDFSANRLRLDNALAQADSIQAAALALMALQSPEDGRRLGSDSLTALLGSLLSLPTFEPVTKTYDNILGAGDLLTIQSSELRGALAEFQSRLILMNVVQETQERQLVGIFQPYVIEHLDYVALLRTSRRDHAETLPSTTNADAVYGVLGSRQFRNWVAVRWEWARDLGDQHRQVRESVDNLMTTLRRVAERPGTSLTD